MDFGGRARDVVEDAFSRRGVVVGVAVLASAVLALVLLVTLGRGSSDPGPAPRAVRSAACTEALGPLRDVMAAGVAPAPERTSEMQAAYQSARLKCNEAELDSFVDEMQAWLTGLGPSATSVPAGPPGSLVPPAGYPSDLPDSPPPADTGAEPGAP